MAEGSQQNVAINRSLVCISCFALLCFFPRELREFRHCQCAHNITLRLQDNPHDVEGALHKVEWDTLIFFAALFVLVRVSRSHIGAMKEACLLVDVQCPSPFQSVAQE